MKGYLLLENGIKFSGAVVGDHKNVIGFISSRELLEKKIQINNMTIELCDDNGCMPINMKLDSQMLAKIVVDSLPLDYHLYDLKTFIS
ncbi:MAG: hypothetical protein JW702_04310 [Clostridiales bacterium]|nr:hypothetical protein [Clostridiales bacterium]